jgi:hypothetical protein
MSNLELLSFGSGVSSGGSLKLLFFFGSGGGNGGNPKYSSFSSMFDNVLCVSGSDSTA